MLQIHRSGPTTIRWFCSVSIALSNYRVGMQFFSCAAGRSVDHSFGLSARSFLEFVNCIFLLLRVSVSVVLANVSTGRGEKIHFRTVGAVVLFSAFLKRRGDWVLIIPFNNQIAISFSLRNSNYSTT